jgi:hypothetical protein
MGMARESPLSPSSVGVRFDSDSCREGVLQEESMIPREPREPREFDLTAKAAGARTEPKI